MQVATLHLQKGSAALLAEGALEKTAPVLLDGWRLRNTIAVAASGLLAQMQGHRATVLSYVAVKEPLIDLQRAPLAAEVRANRHLADACRGISNARSRQLVAPCLWQSPQMDYAWD